MGEPVSDERHTQENVSATLLTRSSWFFLLSVQNVRPPDGGACVVFGGGCIAPVSSINLHNDSSYGLSPYPTVLHLQQRLALFVVAHPESEEQNRSGSVSRITSENHTREGQTVCVFLKKMKIQNASCEEMRLNASICCQTKSFYPTDVSTNTAQVTDSRK